MDRERRLNLLIIGLTLTVAVGLPFLIVKTDPLGAFLASDSGASLDCEDFSFDRTAWDEKGDFKARQEQANGLAECHVLAGMSRDEVAALLDDGGSRHPNPDRWVYFAGETNDYMGPGDSVSLNVFFGRDGAVTGAKLTAPLD